MLSSVSRISILKTFFVLPLYLFFSSGNSFAAISNTDAAWVFNSGDIASNPAYELKFTLNSIARSKVPTKPGDPPQDLRTSFEALKAVQDWQDPAKDYYVSADLELIRAGCTPATCTWPGIELRMKGSIGSFRPFYDTAVDSRPPGDRINLYEKSAFKVKFKSSLPFYGLKKLTLNNMVGDPSKVRETITYDLFREMNIAAPRTGYAKVTFVIKDAAGVVINTMDYGLYLNVETMDKEFLPRWYGSNNLKHLYEGSYTINASGNPEGCDFTDLSDADLVNFRCFEVDESAENPESRADLASLITAASANLTPWEWRENIKTQIDLTQMISMWAAEVYTAHWDGYINAGNNYYVHSDASGKFTMLPWGVDDSLERADYSFDYQPWRVRSILFKRCLDDVKCHVMYGNALKLVRSKANSLALNTKAAALYAELRPMISADPFIAGADLTRNQEYDIAVADASGARVVSFLNERVNELEAWLTCCDHPDTDDDGLYDADDIYPNISIEGYLDPDRDGAPTTCDSACLAAGMIADNCGDALNKRQNDLDGDLQGDACDSDVNNDGAVNSADILYIVQHGGGRFTEIRVVDGVGGITVPVIDENSEFLRGNMR